MHAIKRPIRKILTKTQWAQTQSSSKTSLVFMFTGQGSQYVGMGKDLYKQFKVVRKVFEEIDESLKFSLTKLILDGVAPDIDLTENAQPAILAYSSSVMAILNSQLGHPVLEHAQYLVGHSVGEFCALEASGALERGEASQLLRFRGLQMQQSLRPGFVPSMAALYPFSEEEAQNFVFEMNKTLFEPIDIANVNSPQQIVISGPEQSVDMAIEKGKEKMLFRKSTKLKVSAPFHSRYMLTAEKAMEDYLLSRDIIKKPTIDMVSNLTGRPISEPRDITNAIIKSTTKTVRFNDCINYCAKEAACTKFIEIGPRKILCPMVLQNNTSLKTLFLGTPSEIDEFLGSLS